MSQSADADADVQLAQKLASVEKLMHDALASHRMDHLQEFRARSGTLQHQVSTAIQTILRTREPLRPLPTFPKACSVHTRVDNQEVGMKV